MEANELKSNDTRLNKTPGAIIVRIRRMRAEGLKAKAIAEVLNKEGLKPARGDTWRPSRIYSLIAARKGKKKPKRRAARKSSPNISAEPKLRSAGDRLKAIRSILALRGMSADERIALAQLIAD